ncbi:hypothetical protein BJY01DRAFT_245520 [Aspergillus pseudoustus]|uniref:RNase III domain-containing protein n=1 Tax=Aspergillus pseudoustus TaxID=1810923 RepID=A0ABR4KDF1_9EURO
MAPPPVIPIQERVRAFLTRFNIVLNDTNLSVEMLRAPGYGDSTGNRDLAGIGDSALRQYYQVEGCARRMSRGDIQDIIGRVTSNEYLAARGFELGIDTYILNNPSNQGAVPVKLMAATMEATIGAVFLDNEESLAAVRSIIAQFDSIPSQAPRAQPLAPSTYNARIRTPLRDIQRRERISHIDTSDPVSAVDVPARAAYTAVLRAGERKGFSSWPLDKRFSPFAAGTCDIASRVEELEVVSLRFSVPVVVPASAECRRLATIDEVSVVFRYVD